MTEKIMSANEVLDELQRIANNTSDTRTERAIWAAKKLIHEQRRMIGELAVKLGEALGAAESKPSESGQLWKHEKTGNVYVELGRAQVRASDEVIREDDWLVLYRSVSVANGKPWAQIFAREVSEFQAKFEAVKP